MQNCTKARRRTSRRLGGSGDAYCICGGEFGSRDADRIAASGYNPADYDTGQEVLTIDGEHDLFGDGW